MSSSGVHFYPGDVLYARLRPYLNKVWTASFEGLGSAEFIVFAKRAEWDSNFLKFLLNSQAFVSFANSLDEGDRPRVDFAQIAAFELALPPRNEQERIADAIAAALDGLTNAVQTLQRQREGLSTYRAAVLRAACEGRLVPTEAELARAERRSYDPAEALLARALEERRAKWEADKLARMNARGKAPRDGTWKKLYVEPAALDLADLPEPPEGWCFAPLGLLGLNPNNTVQTGPFGAQLHNTAFVSSGVPVIAVGNLTGLGFTNEGLYFISEGKAAQLARYGVEAGDVLFARSGATLGKVAVAPPYVRDWRMTGHILRARLNTALAEPRFVVFALRGCPLVLHQVSGGIRGVTRPGFNTSLLENIVLPLPPVSEQHRIVAEVDRRLSVVEHLEAAIARSLQRAARLRQAILKQAFEGRLVPQDPNDEPASVLLERIRKERERTPETKGRVRRRRATP